MKQSQSKYLVENIYDIALESQDFSHLLLFSHPSEKPISIQRLISEKEYWLSLLEILKDYLEHRHSEGRTEAQFLLEKFGISEKVSQCSSSFSLMGLEKDGCENKYVFAPRRCGEYDYCPICEEKATNEKALHTLRDLSQVWRNSDGYYFVKLTLTIPRELSEYIVKNTNVSESISKLFSAVRKFVSRFFSEFSENSEKNWGCIVSVDVSGEKSWKPHIHFHCLVFTRKMYVSKKTLKLFRAFWKALVQRIFQDFSLSSDEFVVHYKYISKKKRMSSVKKLAHFLRYQYRRFLHDFFRMLWEIGWERDEDETIQYLGYVFRMIEVFRAHRMKRVRRFGDFSSRKIFKVFPFLKEEKEREKVEKRVLASFVCQFVSGEKLLLYLRN